MLNFHVFEFFLIRKEITAEKMVKFDEYLTFQLLKLLRFFSYIIKTHTQYVIYIRSNAHL